MHRIRKAIETIKARLSDGPTRTRYGSALDTVATILFFGAFLMPCANMGVLGLSFLLQGMANCLQAGWTPYYDVGIGLGGVVLIGTNAIVRITAPDPVIGYGTYLSLAGFGYLLAVSGFAVRGHEKIKDIRRRP